MGRGNDEHFSQLTKQCYFIAKIILKYCSGDSMDHVGGKEAEIQLPLKRSSRFQRLFPNPSWLV